MDRQASQKRLKEGWALAEKERLDEAEKIFREETEKFPDILEGWIALGHIKDRISRRDGSLFGGKDEYAHVLSKRIVPELVMDMGNILLRNELRWEEAEMFYREAVIRHGMIANAQNFAICLLNTATIKRTPEGWREAWQWYEWREMNKLRANAFVWRGEPLAGKRLLVQFEQGFGDHVWGMRFIKQAKEEGATTIAVTRPNTMRLCMAQPYIDEVYNGEDKYKIKADYLTMLMSMPGYMLPASMPRTEGRYIETDIEPEPHEGLRVGLAWNGSVDDNYQSWRNINPSLFSAFLEARPDVEFVSLQKGHHAKDAPEIEIERSQIERCADLWDTARLIDTCDLVITTDTLIPHLSSALGVETWMMDRWSSAWHFGIGGPESDPHWYEALKIFRQPSFGDWNSVINRICQELKQWKYSTSQPMEASFITPRKTERSSCAMNTQT